MFNEIILILIVGAILAVLLRHWPQTKDSLPRQQVNTRRPLEEKEHPKRLRTPDQIGGVKRILNYLQGLTGMVVRIFSDRHDKQPSGIETAKKSNLSDQEWFDDNSEKPSVLKTDDKEDPIASKPRPNPVAIEAESDFSKLLTQADTAQRKGEYDEAEKLLVKAVALDPKNPRAYSKLGILYLEQGENWKEAEESFRQSLKYESGNGYVHNNLGLVLYNQDKFTAAATEFERAVAIDHSIPSRHVNLGLAYLSLRQYSKAESAFKRAFKMDPQNLEYQELAKEAASKKRSHQQR